VGGRHDAVPVVIDAHFSQRRFLEIGQDLD
jgi:hypothetical protein